MDPPVELAWTALTHAQPARGIQRQTPGTLAAEGAGRVETASIGTEAGEGFTLIDI